MLAANPPKGQINQGKMVCSCFGVGFKQIVEAIKHNQLSTVEQISARLQAGTNCGSCLPELQQILMNTVAY